MSQFTLEGTFTLVTCANCGIGFAIPEHFETKRRADHANFYCPSGHSNHWPHQTEAEKLRAAVASQKQIAELWQRRHEASQREAVAVGHQLRSTKGVVTRIKRRVAHGVCPCCQRTFADLARHMNGQHPEFAPASPGLPAGVSR